VLEYPAPQLPDPEAYRVCDSSQPFITDLSTQSVAMIRATLQAGKGLIAVRYVGCSLEVLGGCSPPGEYDAVSLSLVSATEIPLDAHGRDQEGALTNGFPALKNTGSMSVRTAQLLRAPSIPALSANLPADCQRATHFVSDVAVGSMAVFDDKRNVVTHAGCAGLRDVPGLAPSLLVECPTLQATTDRWALYAPLRVTLVPVRKEDVPRVKCGEDQQLGVADPATHQAECVPKPWPLPPAGSPEFSKIQADSAKLLGAHTSATNMELAQAYERAQIPEGVARALKPVINTKTDASVIFSYAAAQRTLNNGNAFLEALRYIVARPERSDDRARANYELVNYFCGLGQSENARGFYETLTREFPGSKWWQSAQPIATKCLAPPPGSAGTSQVKQVKPAPTKPAD
jgi:hypothetical protein